MSVGVARYMSPRVPVDLTALAFDLGRRLVIGQSSGVYGFTSRVLMGQDSEGSSREWSTVLLFSRVPVVQQRPGVPYLL